MSDLTQEAGIVEFPDDATGISPHSGAETAAVPNAFATELAELAWSHEDARAEISTSKDASPDERRGPAWWIAAIAAVLVTAAAAVWLGTVLHHQLQPQPVKAPVAMPTPTALPPPAVPPPPAAPPETSHPAAKYPWVSVVVSQPMNAARSRAVSSAFGTTAEAARQRATQECQTDSKRSCSEAATVVNGCVVAALGSNTFEGGSGPTRTTALADTKANFPWATSFYTYCSWDGNDS